MRTYSVYYMKPEFFREGIMGYEWLKQKNMLPDRSDLSKTHVFLKDFEAHNLEDLFFKAQGDNWSPNGEARPLIEEKGLTHTSMSVGDIAVDQLGVIYLVDDVGFRLL